VGGDYLVHAYDVCCETPFSSHTVGAWRLECLWSRGRSKTDHSSENLLMGSKSDKTKFHFNPTAVRGENTCIVPLMI
jgi:hypothetical protein